MYYSFDMWLLFFYIYCVLGWCFESAYVSLCSRQYVNRGFLKGPFLPIYGSGAILVLFTTLPFKKSVILVYIIGAMTATILELVTGLVMEAIFKVKYWDYSNQRIQFKGVICLSSSIAWGFFSIGLIYGLHAFIEKIVLAIPIQLVTALSFAVTIILVVDITLSVKTALELRDILEKVDAMKQEFKRLQRRLEVIEAIVLDETAQKKDAVLEEIEQIKEKQQQYRVRIRGAFSKDKLAMIYRNPSSKASKYKEMFEEIRSDIKSGINDLTKKK